MKIKDFIKELKKYDENIEVVVYDWEDKTYDNYFEFNEEVESYKIWKDWKPIWSRVDKNLAQAELNTWDRWKVVRKPILVIYPDW